jgi:exopolyphosphatase/pppGpp-phosphohydrolase
VYLRKNTQNSVILDIGGGNTKGGYVDVRNDVFVFSTSCSFGTITLTEAVIKITKKKICQNLKKSHLVFTILRNK